MRRSLLRKLSAIIQRFMKSAESSFKGIVLRRPRKLSQRNLEVFDSLGPDDVTIDCGANVGDVTAVMAERGATVFAFEPNPHAFELLEKRFEENPKVVCIQKGVSNRDDTLKLYMHRKAGQDQVGRSTGSSLLESKSNVNANDWIEVEVISLSKFIKELNTPIALVKMDIEGAEFDVLEDLVANEVFSSVGELFVETHEKRIPSLRERKRSFEQLMRERNITNINLDWI